MSSEQAKFSWFIPFLGALSALGPLSNDLFVPSPGLPPCGRNANASRTWLNIYDDRGVRLYGWCAIR